MYWILPEIVSAISSKESVALQLISYACSRTAQLLPGKNVMLGSCLNLVSIDLLQVEYSCCAILLGARLKQRIAGRV